MPYLVSTYAPKGSLRERLQRQAPYPLSVQEALTTITRLGQALTYAHERQMLHGAIKPENVLFDASNEVLLADFRITAVYSEPISEAVTCNENYAYMAPEQFTGRAAQSSDQYALGCLAYELLTGRVPFAGTTPTEVQAQQWNEPLLPPRQLNPTIPVHVEQAILKALALQPSERY